LPARDRRSHVNTTDTIFLVCGEPGPAERHLAKLVQFWGGVAKLVRLPEGSCPPSFAEVIPAGGRVMLSASVLFGWKDLQGITRALKGWSGHLLIYGFEGEAETGRRLSELTSGTLVGVELASTEARGIRVADGAREICGQLAGLEFEVPGLSWGLTFKTGPGREGMPLLWLGSQPFLVRFTLGDCSCLLLAGDGIADLDATVSADDSLLQYFPNLVPVLMFLRWSGGEIFWHADAPKACFIIDDPLLKKKYGYLDYRALLEAMERHNFCTSIAFIPWNYGRSDQDLVDLFVRFPQRYSLCTHGCDHTRGEFGVTELAVLRQKCLQALERMRSLRERSGLGFDDVMVFPQGIFSSVAMKALSSGGYLAAVNTTPHPVNSEETLTLADLLGLAVTRFSNFPLFVRRQPTNLAALALDLFLGRPALLVAHHQYFRRGYEELAEAVAQLNLLDKRLQWTNLATICSQACWKRTVGEETQVLFVTDRFHLQNETETARRYRLIRRGLLEGQPVSFRVNGQSVEMVRREREDQASTVVSVAAGAQVEVEVNRGTPEPSPLPVGESPLYRAKVFLRRRLSEWRDNYLDKSFVSDSARRFAARIARRPTKPLNPC